MPRVIIVQVIYNNKKWIKPVFSAVFAQTFKDFKFVAVIAGSDDGSKELIASEFPEVEIIDPGYNIGFAKGHNLVFERYRDAEFFQLVNPDLILEPDYVEEMLKTFGDEKAGAATGKLYQSMEHGAWSMEHLRQNRIIDTTGITISKSGRARDRGQHEEDERQYDNQTLIPAVSGAGCMYRKSALEAVKLPKIQNPKSKIQINSKYEYFDEDFHSYWEDVDLAWRMTNAGWKCVFAPAAVGYHGRVAGSSKGGYKKVFSFISHHRNLPERIRRLNYQNHIFMYIKNSKWFYPQFFAREFFMLCYIILFEIGTLKILPEMLKNLPKIWMKRKLIFR